jgi:hypothetical protein
MDETMNVGQDIIALVLVAGATLYMLVRLRRLAAGESKCACGSKSCGPAAPFGGQTSNLVQLEKPKKGA